MSRARWGLKHPEKIMISLEPAVAEQFRKYCATRQYVLSRVIEDLLVEHLSSEGFSLSPSEQNLAPPLSTSS